MAKKKKKTKKVEEEVTATIPETTEEPAVTPIEEPQGVTEPEPAPEPKKSLDERLLEYYNNAEVGSVNVEVLKQALGANEEQISHAWDRLYDQGKIEFGKFVKSWKS